MPRAAVPAPAASGPPTGGEDFSFGGFRREKTNYWRTKTRLGCRLSHNSRGILSKHREQPQRTPAFGRISKWSPKMSTNIEDDIAAVVRDRDSSSSNLRLGLWRAWLIFAALWTITVLYQYRPELTLDCGYLAGVSRAAWAACSYHGDFMWFSALALLMVPPPLVLIVGYWIVRGFRPDFGGINKRIAIGVALMPVWLFWIVLNMHWPKDYEMAVGSVIAHAAVIVVFAFIYQNFVHGMPFRRLPDGEFEVMTETGLQRFPDWKTLWAWSS
jgi:hypothetical protein